MRPFLYPSLDWAWRKIERGITAMGERGTKVPVPEAVEGKEV
jgi:NAD+ synthase (glutamine-hydrolysing)